MIRALLLTILLTASTGSALAQRVDNGLTRPSQEADARTSYPVEALAGVMGELHYLTFTCQDESRQEWRTAMLELLEMEAPTRGAYRDRLTESFNDGYRYHQRRRTRCGAEAEMARRTLATQGRAFSETLRREYMD